MLTYNRNHFPRNGDCDSNPTSSNYVILSNGVGPAKHVAGWAETHREAAAAMHEQSQQGESCQQASQKRKQEQVDTLSPKPFSH